jgi:hypothetical protein
VEEPEEKSQVAPLRFAPTAPQGQALCCPKITTYDSFTAITSVWMIACAYFAHFHG